MADDINFGMILSRFYSDNDWDFETIERQEQSYIPGVDLGMTTKIVAEKDYFAYARIIWNDGVTPKPTEQECIDIWAIITNEQAVEAIHEKRRNEYPGWQEFAEAMWNAMDSGLLPKVEPWFTECATVKANNPLP